MLHILFTVILVITYGFPEISWALVAKAPPKRVQKLGTNYEGKF